MGNWYKQITLLLAAASSLWLEPQIVGAEKLANEVRACPDLNSSYQEVYSFETENYHINVCQLKDNFYYHRQSKSENHVNNIFVPAQPILQGSVFQATLGKIVYFVGLDGDRHYSSVMLNNNEIVFEPEIKSVAHSSAQKSANSSDRNLQNASWELDSPTQESSATFACAREKSAFHPHLDGWQELVGKPISSASNYAVSNGFDFDYNREKNPALALITTEAGGTINLRIVPVSEIVEQVCLQASPEAEN